MFEHFIEGKQSLLSPLRSDISQSLVEGGHDYTKLASIFEIDLICVLYVSGSSFPSN